MPEDVLIQVSQGQVERVGLYTLAVFLYLLFGWMAGGLVNQGKKVTYFDHGCEVLLWPLAVVIRLVGWTAGKLWGATNDAP